MSVTLQKCWMGNLGNAMARNMKIRPGRNPYGLVLVQSAQHLQKNVIPSLWQCSTVTLQKWWMSILGNAMARNMKSRPGRNPYELLLVQSAWNLQKNDSYAFNSEQKNFRQVPSDPWHMSSYFWPFFGCLLVNFPSVKSTFPYFSSPRGLATSVSFPEARNWKETESGLPKQGTSFSEHWPRRAS